MDALIPPTDLWPFSWTCIKHIQRYNLACASADPFPCSSETNNAASQPELHARPLCERIGLLESIIPACELLCMVGSDQQTTLTVIACQKKTYSNDYEHDSSQACTKAH